MAKYETTDIRNIALFGHSGAGKTTLAERILFTAKVTTRPGNVMDGSSLFDSEPDEKERQCSINSAIASANWNGTEYNIIDTPGMADFVSDSLNALGACDLALICVDANSGVKVNTRRMWAAAEKFRIPCFVVVTRMDGEHADFEKTLGQVQSILGANCLPLHIAKAGGANFKSLEPVLGNETDDAAKAAAEKLTESVVEIDEELTMRYLEGEAISADEIKAAFRKAVLARTVVPVIPLASDAEVGITELLDAIRDFGPSPVDEKRQSAPLGDEPEWSDIDFGGSFVARVFKSVWTPFGRMGVFRILAGGIKAGDSIKNVHKEKTEKLGHIFRPHGKELKEVESAVTGEIIAVTKIESLEIGDSLVGASSAPVQLRAVELPVPMVSLAVEPKTRGDEQKISGALNRLADEDRTFKITRDAQTSEMVVHGMSTLHLETTLARLKARSGVEVDTKLPKIPYRETIGGNGDAKYRHKKQTGGAGEFGEVHLRVSPVERGAGFQFKSSVVGGNIPHQFISSIEKGIRQTLGRGLLAGCEIVDVCVDVYDGKHHPVDSKDVAFQKAGRGAFKQAFLDAKPQLLEPVVKAEINAPNDYMGAIMSDLNSRRARIQNTEQEGGYCIVTAEAPLKELQTYSTELKSITAGEGSYLVEFSHYEAVPQHVAKDVMAQYKTDDEED